MKVGIWNDVISQERPRGILLERRNAMIETRQIGPRVMPQTQRGPKHEKHIPKILVDFSFLENQTIRDLYFPFISTG